MRFKDVERKDTYPVVPFDGVPFCILSSFHLACFYGPDKHAKDKRERENTQPDVLTQVCFWYNCWIIATACAVMSEF